MQIDYPFHFDSRGHTASTQQGDHIRDLIEQVLFTAPGERVNRPDLAAV
jgi:phage baseplate assembly protein W